MFSTKMWIFYGFSALVTLIIFSLLGVTWWKGYVIFAAGGLYITFFDKLQGLIKIPTEGNTFASPNKEAEDGLGY